MSKKKKRILILGIIAAVAIVVSAPIIAIKCYLVSRENKAIKLAEEYLDSKYDFDVKYEYVFYSWISEPAFYRIGFSPVDDPELKFQVTILDTLEIQDTSLNENKNRSLDSYYLKYFDRQMAEFLLDDAKQIWGDDTKVTVLKESAASYRFYVPAELRNDMPLKEKEELLSGYMMWIMTNKFTLDTTDESEKKIYEFIQVLKSYGFTPKKLFFEDFDNDNGFFSIDDPCNIDSVEQLAATISKHLPKQ